MEVESRNPCKKLKFYDDGKTLKNFTKKNSMTGFVFLSFEGQKSQGHKTGERMCKLLLKSRGKVDWVKAMEFSHKFNVI